METIRYMCSSSQAPVGAAARADGQEEDEKKMDGGKKKQDWQARDGILLILPVAFFPGSSLLSLCSSLKNKLPFFKTF